MMRRVLKLAGIGLVLVVFAFISLFVSLGMASRRAQKASSAIKAGMTIEQFVQSFPRDSDMAFLEREENPTCDSSPGASAAPPLAAPKTGAPKLEDRRATERPSPGHDSKGRQTPDRQTQDRQSAESVSEDCLPPSVLFVTWPAQAEGKVNVRSSSAGRKLDVTLRSGAEFVTFLKSELSGRPWQAHFAYRSNSPRTYSFTVHLGPDGKVIGAPTFSSLD